MARDYITKTERYNILKEQKWRCAICGVKLNFSKKHDNGEVVAHIDHIHPISKTNTYPRYINEKRNLQGLCERCNLLKSDKPQYYCPTCGKPLEIGTCSFPDMFGGGFEMVWVCNGCSNFFDEYECLKKKPKPL